MSRLSSFHELIWSFSAVLWLSRYINTVSENPSLVPRLCQVNAYIHKHATNYRERLCAVLCLVTQSCPTLCDPMDCSPPGSSVHGILYAKILEWVVMPSSRGSSQLRDRTQVSHIAGEFFTDWATTEAHWDYRHIICMWPACGQPD